MKLSVEIIILFNACYENEHFYNVTGTTIAGADIDAIRNLNNFAKTLTQPDGTLTNPGNLNVAGNINIGNSTKGLKIEQGTGDGATYDTYNGALSSWNGLALRSNCSDSNCGPLGGKPSHVFNTRNGDTFLKGNVTTGGLTTAKKINLQFDKWENNLLDNKHAYIVNDNTNYKALMIAGNDVQVTGVREVEIYDNLTVARNTNINGNLTVGGRNILQELDDIKNRGFFEGQKAKFRSHDVNRWLSENNHNAEVRGDRGVWSQFNLIHA